MAAVEPGRSVLSDPFSPAAFMYENLKWHYIMPSFFQKSFDPWGSLSRGTGLPWSGFFGARSLMFGEQAMLQGTGYGAGRRVLSFISKTGENIARRFRSGAVEKYFQSAATKGLWQFQRGGITDVIGTFLGGHRAGMAAPGSAEALKRGMFGTRGMGITDAQARLVRMQLRKTGIFGKIKAAFGSTKITDWEPPIQQLRTKVARKMLAGTIGTIATRSLWFLSLADIGFQLGRFAVGTGISAVNTLTARLAAINPGALEFGGNLSPGFYAGRTATERQRALEAIRNSRLNARSAIGNEAAMVSGGF